MIDNLQVLYLQQLEQAFEHSLHGRVETAVDICFELRARSDLGYYPRAMVNMALADLTNLEKYPDKAKFAREALRLAAELYEDLTEENDTYWSQTYAELIVGAGTKLDAIETEKAQKEKKGKPLEMEIEDMSLGPQALASRCPPEAGVVEVSPNVFCVNADEVPIPNRLPVVEGIFDPRIKMAESADEGVDTDQDEIMREAKDTLPELPELSQRSTAQARDTSGPPTPPASSRHASEAP